MHMSPDWGSGAGPAPYYCARALGLNALTSRRREKAQVQAHRSRATATAAAPGACVGAAKGSTNVGDASGAVVAATTSSSTNRSRSSRGLASQHVAITVEQGAQASGSTTNNTRSKGGAPKRGGGGGGGGGRGAAAAATGGPGLDRLPRVAGHSAAAPVLESSRPVTWSKLREMMTLPTFLIIILQVCVCLCVRWG